MAKRLVEIMGKVKNLILEIMEKTRGNRCSLYVSHDFGINYVQNCTNDETEIEEILSSESHRWFIRDNDNEIIYTCCYIRSFVDSCRKIKDAIYATEDIACREILARHGIKTVNAAHVIAEMMSTRKD